ncbi:hypothetical protein HPB48_008379 [Haemaphysalis longicornis]|uniref:Uncharacterized protein n=1 Tax=Haemaphysalis longicornis TaxID=44386 RepID=A0A9J6FC56_HAELO|nr:hypothetical protein HPB48_008379 [Haemaphysalis longicornis]
MQIRALMEKMDALASGRAAARAVKPNEASGDANAKRKVPRRDPPSSSIARGEASPSTSAQRNQEEMDAETSMREETATPQSSQKMQPPQGGDMAAILAAINQITEQYGVIRAELQAMETQVKGMSIKQERQAAKMAAMTAKSRFAALKKGCTNRIKETVASRRGRVTTSEEDEPKPSREPKIRQKEPPQHLAGEPVDLGNPLTPHEFVLGPIAQCYLNVAAATPAEITDLEHCTSPAPLVCPKMYNQRPPHYSRFLCGMSSRTCVGGPDEA